MEIWNTTCEKDSGELEATYVGNLFLVKNTHSSYCIHIIVCLYVVGTISHQNKGGEHIPSLAEPKFLLSLLARTHGINGIQQHLLGCIFPFLIKWHIQNQLFRTGHTSLLEKGFHQRAVTKLLQFYLRQLFLMQCLLQPNFRRIGQCRKQESQLSNQFINPQVSSKDT